MTRFVFVVPDPTETVSAGCLYSRAIAVALVQAGHAVEHAPASAIGEIAGDARVVVDGTASPSLEAWAEKIPGPQAAALIHHPTPRDASLDDVERERLRSIETAVYARFARVIAASDDAAKRLTAEFGVPADRISVVTPGAPDAPRSPGSAEGTCEALSIGALIPSSGHDFLMRALARLFDLDWRLTIVGGADRDPAHARALTSLADELKISQRVTFAGETDEAALMPLWRNADIFALAARFESCGVSVTEALKRGVPPAVTAGTGVAALVTQQAGTVCALADFPSYSKSLRRMIFDKRLRADMANAAWRIGQTLPDWPTQAALFAKAITG